MTYAAMDGSSSSVKLLELGGMTMRRC